MLYTQINPSVFLGGHWGSSAWINRLSFTYRYDMLSLNRACSWGRSQQLLL